jgi:hypothetical protein
MGEIRFNRIWAMPNSATFSIKPIRELLDRILLPVKGKKVIDPFVGDSPYKSICVTNDLNPSVVADYHLDAIDFVRQFEDCSVDAVIFDPPYSVRQVAECYKGVGHEVTSETTRMTFYSNIKDQIARIVKPNGIVVSFGWTTMGLGKNRGFSIKEILIVPHGGTKNDTLVTVEEKVQSSFTEAH